MRRAQYDDQLEPLHPRHQLDINWTTWRAYRVRIHHSSSSGSNSSHRSINQLKSAHMKPINYVGHLFHRFSLTRIPDAEVPIDPSFIPTDDQLNEHLAQFDFESTTGGCWTPKDCRPRQRVAIVIPYKNRAEHLQALLYRLHPMLHRQKTAYCIFVAEQVKKHSFYW